MASRKRSQVRPGVEELENRLTPARLMPGAVPGLGATLAGHAQVRTVESAAAHSHDRPFHLEESGAAVINPDGTISASATGTATHLGAFTLHDHSTIVGVDTANGLVLQVVGHADLEAANGDHLCASFTGSINLTAGTGTLNFAWTGGTGRFANATGATVWHVSVNPDLTYTAVADGVIND
jgi:hypothetical protein